MPDLLKNIYNDTFFGHFTTEMKRVVPEFHADEFIDLVHDKEWENRELKDRMKHIAVTLKRVLPFGFEEACARFTKLALNVRNENEGKFALEYMFLPEFVERFGLNQFNVSVDTMEKITSLTSCEFAVRPFIVEYGDRMMNRMEKWSVHDNHHVRRLASEGCRPRLPWAMALKEFKKDPNPILPILENLKKDESEYVRRSVANNLNDISKDHPELVLSIGREWMSISDETDRIVKHACRTLLKKGNPDALDLFGYREPDGIEVSGLNIDAKSVAIGDKLTFSFILENRSKEKKKLRIEYAIDYMKSNGTTNRKVFKITENSYPAGEQVKFTRNQSFKDMTTRKHYPGEHGLAIIINGRVMQELNFVVKV